MFTTAIKLISLFSLISVLLVAIASCGGSGGANSSIAGQGRVTLTITWPSTRAIPTATRSIKIVAKVLEPENGPQVAEQVIQRPENQPTSQVVLDDLPSVKVLITATAHTSADGSGNVLASGSAQVQVPENNSIEANIQLEAEAFPCEASFAEAMESGVSEPDLVVTGTSTASLEVEGLELNVSPMRITASATVSDSILDTHGQGLFQDGIIVSHASPNPIPLTFVFEVTTQLGEGTNATYRYWVSAPGANPFEIFGEYRDGALSSGVQPVNGEINVSGVVLPNTVAGLAIRLQNRTFTEGDFLSNSIRFKRIEGLPDGATVRTRSCTGWLGG